MTPKLTNLIGAYKPAEKSKEIKALSIQHTSVPNPCFQALSKAYAPKMPNLPPLGSNGFFERFPTLSTVTLASIPTPQTRAQRNTIRLGDWVERRAA